MKSLDTPLNKDELTKSLKREYFLAGDKKTLCYVFVITSVKSEFLNPGVPSMLITAISQFAEKPKDELVSEDAFNMFNSINFFLKDDVNYSTIKQWRKYVRLTFFGMKQYNLLEYYLNN